jgi:hypothetical protein
MLSIHRALARLALPLAACLLAGAAAAAVTTTKVSYLAGAMVYADMGSLDGLQPGDSVQVFHGTTPVAMLKVAFVSTRRAACDTVWTRAKVAIGDEMRFTPHAVPPPASAAAPAPPRPGMASVVNKAHRPRIRGRVGGRYLSVKTDGTSFQQPALDLRFEGTDQGAGHVDVAFDIRNRRTVRTSNGESTTDQLSRVYRATVVVRTVDSHRSITLGRQTSAALSSVSLFDGMLVQSGNDRHSYGLFSGTQPDPTSFGLSKDIFENGGFVEFHSPLTAQSRYQLSFGGISSQQGGQPNRDFMFTLGSWASRAFTTTFTQEVDINRGWKRAQGEPALSPTSTFWMMRVMPFTFLGINTGVDNRRNVRLWRDRTTPADLFDDAYRQGMWVGGDVEALSRFRMSGEVRGSAGADHSRSWSGGAEAYRLTALHASVRGRMSEFTSSNVTSRLWSSSLGLDLTPLSHLEASGGVRGTRIAPSTVYDNQNWLSMDLDVTVGRRWYVNGGYEHDYGGNSGSTQQVQGGISWRF